MRLQTYSKTKNDERMAKEDCGEMLDGVDQQHSTPLEVNFFS